jgi:ABC-type histidine transport system ATPase subunit
MTSVEHPTAAKVVSPLIEVRALHKTYLGGPPVLRGVDLRVAPGEVSFLIGPSGGGKSTLLRCINLLETPSSGEIWFGGHRLCHEPGGVFATAPERAIRAARVQMPMVFQQFNLFSHRTVLENIIEGPVIVKRRPRAEAVAEAHALLARVGLPNKADAYPAELSGGQKQRVAIARALAMQPRLILFDEPTSALDPELVSGVLEIIRSLAEEGRTMLVVTHEMGFARKLADRVHFVCDGVIEESGTPSEVFDAPRSARLRGFIGSILK